ncbi:hypothetical protein, partial [Mesorhizobium sp. M1A.F.Ca.IN.022.04.1.1]|uniref:hypothetical protein n=1 Tax=Mesorhizobium sp. M1A.F.Ca.IN.022.04.1.1 TaxID=2496773 RepID=UPI0019D2D2AF
RQSKVSKSSDPASGVRRRDESLVGFGADIDSDFGQSLAKWPKTTKCRARSKAGSRRNASFMPQPVVNHQCFPFLIH